MTQLDGFLDVSAADTFTATQNFTCPQGERAAMICHTAETHYRGPAGQGTQIGKRSHRMDVRHWLP